MRFSPVAPLLAALATLAVLLGATATAESPSDTAAITQIARADVSAYLGGKQVTITVKDLNISGGWAFLYAGMATTDGTPLYQGTEDEEAAAHGGKSHSYAGLFQRTGGGGWQLIDSAVGPTDVAWQNWPQTYGAPASIFSTSG